MKKIWHPNGMPEQLQKFNIEKNLNLIKKQNSKINTIYFVADSSYSSKGLIEDVRKITDNDKRYKYIWLDEDFFKLKKELTKLKENSAIIHLIYFKDEQGITSKYERTLRELYKDIRIPVYTSFNFYLEEENNVLGGYSIDGYKMGETVGKLVEDYFNGKELSHTIVDSGLYSSTNLNISSTFIAISCLLTTPSIQWNLPVQSNAHTDITLQSAFSFSDVAKSVVIQV